jgi:MFS transporter, ACS family, D-galactonate transporter
MTPAAPTLESSATATSPAANPTRWGIVGLLMALCFISHMNRVSMSIAADERIMVRYGITTQQMGWVYSAFLIVYTLFMLPGGMFIDRFGVRLALAAMGFGTALMGALTGSTIFFTAGSLWLGLLVVRAIMGLLTIPLHPASARAVALWVPGTRRSLANGLVTGAALLGIACTPVLFGALMDRIDWPAAFAVTGSATALIALVWLIATRPLAQTGGPAHGRASFATTWKEMLASPSLVLITLSYAAIGYFQYLFFYWMHYYFDEVLKLGKDESRFYYALPVLAMAFTMPLGGWLSDHLQARYGWRAGRSWLAGGSMVAAALLLALGLGTASPLGKVACFTASLGFLGLSEAAFWNTAVELGGTRGGTAAAVMNTGGNGIGLLAPVVTPWIALHLNWQAGIALGGVVAFLGALCWLWIRPGPDTKEAHAL